MPSLRLADCRGDWALVTGASAGIGHEFVRQLAGAGIHVIAVARRQPLLEALADACRQDAAGRVEPLALDLASPAAATVLGQRLAALGQGRLRLVINNAGCGQWGAFDPDRAVRYAEIVQLNNAALVAVTAALLPALLRATPSALINVSSPAAYQPVPFMAVYAASKAFVQQFSLALHEELAPRGVLVQTLVPAPTATQFDALAGAYSSALVGRGAAADVVAAAWRGLESGAPLAGNATGLWKQRVFSALAPTRMVLREVGKMFRPPAG